MNSAALLALVVGAVGAAFAFALAWLRGRERTRDAEHRRKEEAVASAASRRVVGALYNAEREAEIAQKAGTAERVKEARETLEREVRRIELNSPEANREAADRAIDDGLDLLDAIRRGNL